MRSTLFCSVLAVGLMVPVFSGSAARAQAIATDAIAAINGIAVAADPAAPDRLQLYLATQYGLLRATPDGVSTIMPGVEVGLTALVSGAAAPRTLYFSGFAADGKPVGLMASADGGTSWAALSQDAGAATAFRAISVSAADPQVIYAIADALAVSRDGGQSWQASGTLPEQVFSLAASGMDSNTVYAATMTGLKQSRDAGASWQAAYPDPSPTTVVQAVPGHGLYAFVYGVGLIFAQEPGLEWQIVGRDFADRYLVNLTADAANPARLFASVDTGAILTSADGGKSWGSFEGSNLATPENIAAGQQVFVEKCQQCHGVNGIGEAPGDPEAKDEFGFKAPALNDDAHAWHHSDQNLVSFIQEGSPRNTRMVPFKETLSQDQIESLVAYLKSRWSFRSLACQGGRHMRCMAMQ